MKALRTENLVKTYKGRRVVNNVNLEVRRGEVVGLLGPNGAGKTTTFYMIMGAIKPDGGKIFLNSTDITNLPMYRRARLGIGYLPQEASVFRKLSVYENVYSILEMKGFPKDICEEKAEEVLSLLKIDHLKNQRGDQLSGGERRRVEIARSLVLNPEFLLLDEPFTGIDPKTREEIQDIITSLKSLDIGILITDHNVRETLSITDRSYLLFNGIILKSGTSEFLANDEETRRLYLGKRFRLD